MLVAAAALNAHSIPYQVNISLLKKLRGTSDTFAREITILLENGLIPQIEHLDETGIAAVV